MLVTGKMMDILIWACIIFPLTAFLPVPLTVSTPVAYGQYEKFHVENL